MDKEVLYFQHVKPNGELIDEIFNYDVRELEQTNDVTLSKYAIALSQYLIYFKSQCNKTKVDIGRKKRVLDSGINQLITKEVLKQYKSKSDASNYLISNTKDLDILNSEIEALKDELMLLDGIDKTMTELIATFKRELTRRENELYSIRKERRS
jgi:hypothetical protein